MKKLTYVLAILAAASTAAVAKDLKQDQKATTKTPAVSTTQMTDSEMDRVTAGGEPISPGVGLLTASQANGSITPFICACPQFGRDTAQAAPVFVVKP